MKVERLALPEVLLIEPDAYPDDRGLFFETFHQPRYAEIGLTEPFVQDNQSSSVGGVLRGLHAQLVTPQGKLVRALSGEVFDVAVDIRPGSPTFGRWTSATLSGENRLQIWIPPGFAHGFCVLSAAADVAYKCTRLYDPKDEIGVRWDDPELAIEWPIEAPLISSKDRQLPTLAELRPRLEAVRP